MFLIILLLIDLIFVLSSFLFAAMGRVSEKHYFLGTGNPLFTLRIRDIKFSVAWWFPMAINFKNFGGLPVTQVQAIVDGTKQRARQAWEFNEKSILRRLLVTIAPSLVLVTIGIVYSIGIVYTTVESFLSKDSVNVHGIYPSQLGRELGFKRGDKVVAFNGNDFESFDQIMLKCGLEGCKLTVLRQGTNHEIKVPGTNEELMMSEYSNFITPDVSFSVRFVRPDSPASIVGIEPGDKVVSINGNAVRNFEEMRELLDSDDDGKVEIIVERKSHAATEELTKHVNLNDDGSLGISPEMDYKLTSKRLTLFAAIQKGTLYAFSQVNSVIRIMTGKVAWESTTGPIRITPVDQTQYYWLRIAGPLVVFFALLSFVPIPGTIFWSLCALLFEAIRGKTPSHQSVANAQKYGLYFIMILAALVIFSDVLRLVQSI
jgi:regulator of sigma E protease